MLTCAYRSTIDVSWIDHATVGNQCMVQRSYHDRHTSVLETSFSPEVVGKQPANLAQDHKRRMFKVAHAIRILFIVIETQGKVQQL